MNDMRTAKPSGETITKTAKLGSPCYARPNLWCISKNFLRDATEKIGDLWLMISLT